MGKPTKTEARYRRKLKALRDQVPKIECKGLCHHSCGPVPMSNAEFQLLKDAKKLPQEGALDCPFLTSEKKCSIYEDRPMLCRLFGVVNHHMMRCPHGCEPERYLTEEESAALLKAAHKI